MAIQKPDRYPIENIAIPAPRFPGGSRSRVNLAGKRLRSGDMEIDDFVVFEQWRAAHRAVLNTFQASLRNRTRGKNIVVAQRHKRRNTILDKLDRFPKMELSRMDDVAGCRLIFENIRDLDGFRAEFHKARFKHKRKNEDDRYNYINNPKATGYRGIHDIYSYDVNSHAGADYKGLLVEIQYRTLVQHSWATAVEVVGFITESQPKFQQGDRRYEECMSLASEILSRAHEGMTGAHPGLNSKELLDRFSELDNELHLVRTLAGLNSPEAAISRNRNSILIFKPDGGLSIISFKEATDAMRELFRLEKESPDLDIVLVKADSNEEIRLAFKNYFSDAKDFIRLLVSGQKALSR